MLRNSILSIATVFCLSTPVLKADVAHQYENHMSNGKFTIKGYLETVAFIESSSNYDNKSGGAYQIKPHTLNVLLDRMPVGVTKKNWMQPVNQDFLMTRLIAEAVHTISKLNVEPNALNLYLHHQLGAGLFTKMINSVVSGTNSLSKRDVSLLKGNTPCLTVKSNGQCSKKYVVTGPKSYYDAWRSEFDKSHINIKYDKRQVLYALHSRYIWRVKHKQRVNNANHKSKPVVSKIQHKHVSRDTLKGVSAQARKFFNDFHDYMLDTFGVKVAVKAGGGFRSRSFQLRTYAKGRTKKFRNLRNGKPTRVTWTMSSFHTHGQALDIVWHPTYSQKVSSTLTASMNILIAREMRKFANDHCYGARFLSLKRDPNHVQFGKITKSGRFPTKAELKSTRSWGWFRK